MEKIKKCLNLKKIIFIIVVIYMWLFFYTRILNDNNELIITTSTITLFVIFISIQVLFFLIYKNLCKKNISINKIYLILAFSFLPFYLFAFPQDQIPDEINDYNRSLEISIGRLTSESRGESGAGRELSTNIDKVFDSNSSYEDTLSVIDVGLNNKTKFYNFANKALYSFASYIPQTIGVTFGRLLNTSIMAQIYLGRVFNYLLFVILAYFSIKYLPFKKELALFIFLLPITMQEAVSLSPDAMTIGVSALFISMVLNFKLNKDKIISNKELLLLAILSIALALCKIVYLPLCLLLFLIPNSCFKSKKQRYVYIILTILITTIINLIWLSTSSVYLEAFHHRSNSSLQLEYILSNPLKFIATIINTLDTYMFNYLGTMVGSLLGPLNISTSMPIVICSLGILTSLVIYNKKKFFLNRKEQLFVLFIVFSTILLIFTSLYLQWTSVGNSLVEGIQGRYFLPLLLAVSSVFMSLKVKEMKYKNYLIAFIILANIMALIAVSTSFI